jgi:glycosyltransferase involved in cell wall biosynthesis
MKVAIVIPALNEEASVGRVLRDIPSSVGASAIVVDNGSTDATAAVAGDAGAEVVQQSRPGYGWACLAGIQRALALGAEVIVFLDADYSDRPEELPLLLAPIERGEADLVLGSRLRGRREAGAMAGHSVLGNQLVAALMRWIYGLPLSDLGPFRAVRADLLMRMHLRETTYGWPVEMLAKAARLGARVVEIPVSYRPRIGRSKVSGTMRGTLGAAYFLITRTLAYARWRP